MKRNRLFLVLTLLTLVFVACKSRKPNETSTKATLSTSELPANSEIYDGLTVDQKAKVDFWKADVNGCNKYRDAENASEIAAMLNHLKANQQEVESLLGNPEDNRPSGPYQVFGYFFDGECDGKKLKEGSVYCLLQIYFDVKTGAWHTASVVCG